MGTLKHYVKAYQETKDDYNAILKGFYTMKKQDGMIKQLKSKKQTADGSTLVDRIGQLFEENNYNLRYNEVRHNVELNNQPITDIDVKEIGMLGKHHGFSKGDVYDTIYIIAKNNSYHPIKAYFNTLNHTESTKTIDMFLSCVKMQDSHIATNILKKWLVGIVARVFEDTQNIVLVLEGKQRIGKSTLAKWVCPNPNWFTDSEVDTSNKDSQLNIAHNLIWELGELEKITSKRDASELKAFISKQTIDVRAAYARHSIARKPLASFVATTNNDTFFTDITGNYRYVPLYIKEIDFTYSKINKDDFWSELVSLYHSGFNYTLTPEEKDYQKEVNDKKLMRDSITDYLVDILTPDKEAFTPNTVIFDTLKERGVNITSNDRRVRDAMKKLGYEQARKKVKGKTVRGYEGCQCKTSDVSLSNDEIKELYSN
jgi:predicted P-loop ATPase